MPENLINRNEQFSCKETVVNIHLMSNLNAFKSLRLNVCRKLQDNYFMAYSVNYSK